MPSSSHLLDTPETKVSHPGLDAQHHSAPRINSRVTEPHHTKQGYSVGSATLNPAGSRTQVPSYPGKCSGPLSYRMQHTPQSVVVAQSLSSSPPLLLWSPPLALVVCSLEQYAHYSFCVQRTRKGRVSSFQQARTLSPHLLVEQGHIAVLSLPPMGLHLVMLESQEY